MKCVRAKHSPPHRHRKKIQSGSLQSRGGEFSTGAATFTFAAMQYEEMYLGHVVMSPELVCRNKQNDSECQV